MFCFLLQGDKGEPGLSGDQGGKGKKVLRFESIGFGLSPEVKSYLFHRVSGVYLGALGVQAWLEKRFNLKNQHVHDEEALLVTPITF